jgi:hypothetical protein
LSNDCASRQNVALDDRFACSYAENRLLLAA